jgi:putative transposase
VLALEVSKSQEAPALLAPVLAALAEQFGDRAGVPDGLELRTDHGPQYTGADCARLCREWDVVHTFAPVGCPTGNAAGERLIRTMKEECIWLRDWRNADELRTALAEWVETYNHRRPHQALKWQTPAERRAERLTEEREAA